MNRNKQGLISYLSKNGKQDNMSWEELGKKFGIGGIDATRNIWRRYKLNNLIKLEGSKQEFEQAIDEHLEFEAKINKEEGKGNVRFCTPTVLSEEQIYTECQMDPSKWVLVNIWHKKRGTGFVYSADFKLKDKEEQNRDNFIEFLKTYKSDHKVIKKQVPENIDKYNSCLVFNKQDAHLNKYDVDGKNNIFNRFTNIRIKTKRILDKANISSNLDKIIYILGSDEFNSEWTGMTTKGTPQVNIMDYHESFTVICYHEIDIINMLLAYSNNIEIVYISGNHDEFVGWNLLSWLKCYYREQKNISFDISPEYTKYIKYSNTAMAFNHGDAMTADVLARNFPIEFKLQWSSCDHYFIFTGDKHSELSRDIGGIKFYRIPALDKSNSKWDKKNGYTTGKTEITSFLITEHDGLSDIYKEQL